MLVVLQRSVEEALVGRQIKETVPAEIEENRLLFAGFPGLLSFLDGNSDRVRWLRRRNDTFGSSEHHGRFEGGPLLDGGRLDQPFLEEQADHGRCTVVAKTAGVDAGGNKT